jgi:hypothetical protein
MPLIDRRKFVTLALFPLLAPLNRSFAAPQRLTAAYSADVGILYDMLTLRLDGSIEESVDRTAGEYRVMANGTGSGIANRIDSRGMLRNGRWTPVRSQSWFDIRGRQSRTEIAYHWNRRVIEYHARGETFFLRRLRSVDDTVSVPEGFHIDDVMSATLNYADDRWVAQADNVHRTLVVRRRRADDEGPDDIASTYRAEIVPFELRLTREASGKTVALFDLSRFSSWAKPSRPARIVFGSNRRPEVITSSMILGTSVRIRFTAA